MSDGSLLHIAVRGHGMEYCQRILQFVPSMVNSQDSAGRTPLHLAVQLMERYKIRLLMMNNANSDIPDTEGQTAKALAKNIGVDDWINYYEYNRLTGITSDDLFMAIMQGHENLARDMCYKRRQRLSSYYWERCSSMEMAIFDDLSSSFKKGRDDYYGRHLFAKLLARNGRSLEEHSPAFRENLWLMGKIAGRNLMETACAGQFLCAAWFLATNGLGKDISSPRWRDFLMLAELVGPHLFDPSKLNEECIKGMTPLQVCAAHSFPNTFIQMVARGADINHVDFQGRTALHSAIQANPLSQSAAVASSEESVRKLLRLRAKVDLPGMKPILPLIWTSSRQENTLVDKYVPND